MFNPSVISEGWALGLTLGPTTLAGSFNEFPKRGGKLCVLAPGRQFLEVG